MTTITKCLEFTLPTGAAGMAAGMTRGAIGNQLRALRDNGKIGPFQTKTVGYKYKVWLEKEIDYTVFFLLWEIKNSWHKPNVTDEIYTPTESPYKKT